MLLDLRSVPGEILLGTAFPIVLALSSLGVLIGLRIKRPGQARFWAGAGITGWALLPAAVGTAFSGRAFGELMGSLAPTGSGFAAALAGGSMECLLPVSSGLVCLALLAPLALLLLVTGPASPGEAVRVLRDVPRLDTAAIEAVRGWVYEPTLLNGVAVPVILTTTVNFKLD